MLSDPQFWVAVAFVIFIIAIFNPVKKILNSSLDSKIKEIKNSIEEAENLKDETQITLSNIKKRQNEVELEIKEINEKAKEMIQILESSSKTKFNKLSEKKEILAQAKIEQLGRDANLSIQKYISQTSIESAITLLEKNINQDEKQNLINNSVKELRLILKN